MLTDNKKRVTLKNQCYPDGRYYRCLNRTVSIHIPSAEKHPKASSPSVNILPFRSEIVNENYCKIKQASEMKNCVEYIIHRCFGAKMWYNDLIKLKKVKHND